MIPAKEEVRRLLELLPDDASLEDIQYHIYVRQKILRGLEDVEAGRTLSEEEFEARRSKWLQPERGGATPKKVLERARGFSGKNFRSFPPPPVQRTGAAPRRVGTFSRVGRA